MSDGTGEDDNAERVAIPRMRDVAERAGVSISTVSIFLNAPDQVSTRSAAKVEAAIRELGFVRNDAASQLRRGTSRVVAFVAFDVGDPFSYAVARGARRRAAAAGLMLVLADTDGDAAVEQGYLDLFTEQRARGILLQSVADDTTILERTRAARLPMVMIDYRLPAGGTPSVSVDNRRGGELAIGHLLELGRRRLAFVGGPVSIQQVADRLAGAAQAARARPGVSFEHISIPTRDAAAGQAVAGQILSRPPGERPDGVFCVNDTVAIGMLQALAAEGSVRLPEDIAVVGYNDIAPERSPSLGLTTIRQPHERFGETAVDLLLAGEPAGVVFAPELVVRASTVGAPPAR